MGIKEQILQALKVKNHQSDRELTDHILGVETAQQAINAACRQLALPLRPTPDQSSLHQQESPSSYHFD